MALKLKINFATSLSLILALSVTTSSKVWAAPDGTRPSFSRAWGYNPGPDPETPAGRAYIDGYAELPEYMLMSKAVMATQKFRYIFGMMMARTLFERNSTKIIFIGQAATHIAEAAKQPGTSGFGGRVQSVGNFFGVDRGVSTTNAFLSTIKGQYGAFNSPYLEMDVKTGKPVIRQSSFVDNDLWELSNGRKSEILIKRELFWEWMIKNSPESLGMITVFGGAARDAFAEFLTGRGAEVGSRVSNERLKVIQVPRTKLQNAGGNNEFPVLIDKEEKDIYSILAGRILDYRNAADQELAMKVLVDSGERGINMMVFTGGGTYGSGVVNPAQLGGYNLDDVTINGVKTHSLKGLVLSDGYLIPDHIAFAASPHPSMLSRLTLKQASALIKKTFASLLPLKNLGWRIKPDLDENGKLMVNEWDAGKDYKYGRADISNEYFEFGTPPDRMKSTADASRLDPQTIVVGSRDRVSFDKKKLDAAKIGLPSETKSPDELFAVRPRLKETRTVFDRGPFENAPLMMNSLDRTALFEPKPGKKVLNKQGKDITFETNGIDAYYVKTSPSTGLFGFHRGNFDQAKAFILADPVGVDDWNTARALTGERGQYLNGMMNDLGYGADYLVLKTVPVGMDGAMDEEWEVVRKRTENYRDVMVKKVLENPKIQVIFTDGNIAKSEMDRVLKNLGIEMPVININRDPGKMDSGIVEAVLAAQARLPSVPKKANVVAHMADIPAIHLPYWSRIWEGTGGDHVIEAQGKARGAVRALVAPNWVVKQEVRASADVQKSIAAIKAGLVGLLPTRGKGMAPEKWVGDGNYFAIEKERKKLFSITDPEIARFKIETCKESVTVNDTPIPE